MTGVWMELCPACAARRSRAHPVAEVGPDRGCSGGVEGAEHAGEVVQGLLCVDVQGVQHADADRHVGGQVDDQVIEALFVFVEEGRHEFCGADRIPFRWVTADAAYGFSKAGASNS